MPSQTGTHSLTLSKFPFRLAEGFVLPMIQENSQEIMGRDANPDLEAMRQMSDSGQIRVYVLFKDKDPIGYCLMYLSYNLLWQDIRQAVQLVAYVKPAFRTGCGRWMLKEVDRDLKLAVDRIYRHSRAGTNTWMIYSRLGYEPDESTFVLDC